MTPILLHPDDRRYVRVATADDAKYIEALARKWSNQIGFLPRQAIRRFAEHGRILINLENGDNAGYVLGSGSMRWDRRFANILQTAVPLDLQRQHIGLRLVEAYSRSCLLDPYNDTHCLQCWCAEDIEAMSFWPAAGFIAVASRDAKNARGRKMILWRQALSPLGYNILDRLPPQAGYRAQRTGVVRSLLATDQSDNTIPNIPYAGFGGSSLANC